MKKILSAIKSLFRFFGIDIKFIKKTTKIDAIKYNSLEQTENYYSNSENIKNYLSNSRLSFYEQIFEVLEKNNINLDNLNVADVGCGVGKLFYFINAKYTVQKFVGFDFSTEAVKYANSKYSNAEFFMYNIYEPNNQKFNFVFCTEVIEHLLYPEKALKNLLDMLDEKNNSGLMLTVPNGRTDNFEGHINFWSPESWEVFIKKYTENYKVKFGFVSNKLFALITKK